MNCYLLTHDEPPVIICEEDKKAYYTALEKYDTDEEIGGMVAFLQAETAKIWESTLSRWQGEPPRKAKGIDGTARS